MHEAQELLDALAKRGLLADGDKNLTIFGQPAWREIAAGHEAQRLMDATTVQRDLVACAHATLAPEEPGLCAAWVEHVFGSLGWGCVFGDAADLYEGCCTHDDVAELKVGMIVAVPRHPFGTAGLGHGHVGIYVGDDIVMDCVSGRIRKVPLVLWLSTYGVMEVPRWGWLGHVPLG